MPKKTFLPPPVRRAAIYIRVSTEEQAMHGLSLQAQRESLEEYAHTHNMKVVGIYADEGITARKKYRNRAEFMRMIRDVQSDAIDVIIFIKLDRWFRNVSDYYEIQRILDQHGVEWITTEERYDTTTANGRLNLNIRLSIAQDESDRTGERIKFVFENKVKRGEVISGKIPLGYKIEDKRLAIHEDDAEIVRDIFAQYLNLQSVSSLRKFVMDKYGIVYCHTALRMLLQQQRYIGIAHGQDDFCPPIIERDVFDTVGRIIDRRAQRTSMARTDRVYLFTSLLFCAECGNRLASHTVSHGYIYYRCCRYEKLHLCTHKKRTSELVLERWLLDNLVQSAKDQNAAILATPIPSRSEVDETKLRRKLTKLKDLYLNDLIDREEYQRDYNETRAQLDATLIPPVIPTPIDLNAIESALASYEYLDKNSRKAFWIRIIDRITITNSEEFTVTLI